MGMAEAAAHRRPAGLPRIAGRLAARRTAQPPTEADIDAHLRGVRAEEPRGRGTEFADLIPGVAEMVARRCARAGLKIGSTTGYTRDIMDRDPAGRRGQGFAPDSLVCTGDTADGRPDAADDVQELPRSRRLARLRRREGRRHRGRHRRRHRSRQLDASA